MSGSKINFRQDSGMDCKYIKNLNPLGKEDRAWNFMTW